MNMRKRKLATVRAMAYIHDEAKWLRWIDKILALSPEEEAEHKARRKAQWDDILASLGLLDTPVEEPLVEYDPKNFVHMV